jgi:GMP synthase (glutamine-hydrolysing)
MLVTAICNQSGGPGRTGREESAGLKPDFVPIAGLNPPQRYRSGPKTGAVRKCSQPDGVVGSLPITYLSELTLSDTLTDPVLVVEHEPDCGLSLMADPFADRVEVVRPYRGEPLPRDLQAFSGLIVLGGSMGAMDDDVAPWLPATRHLLRHAVRAEVPTLGICLGGQLLAAACGGTVERGAPGLELGIVPVTPLPTAEKDPFFGRVQQVLPTPEWPVHQYHYDAVTELPADAELIVTGDVYPHQGFRAGSAAWGLQYHPEVSTGLFVEWVENNVAKGEMPAADVLGPVRAGSAHQSRVAQAHAQAFRDVIRAGRTT